MYFAVLVVCLSALTRVSNCLSYGGLQCHIRSFCSLANNVRFCLLFLTYNFVTFDRDRFVWAWKGFFGRCRGTHKGSGMVKLNTTHMRARARTHVHTLMHVHTLTHTLARNTLTHSLTNSQTHTPMHTHTYTYTEQNKI